MPKATKKRDYFSPEMLKESVFVRLVDNYLIYLQDICLLLYDAHPDLIGRIEIRAADILNYTDVSEYQAHIRDQARESISQMRRKSVFNVLQRAGLDSVKNQHGMASIDGALRLRDTLTHRRGLMGGIIDSGADKLWKFGTAVREYESRHGQFLNMMHNSIVEIDQEAIKKFSLQSVEVKSRLDKSS